MFPDTVRGKVDNVRNYIWTTITQPKFSHAATVYAWFDQLFIFVSVCGMIVETLPVIKEKIDEDNFMDSVSVASLTIYLSINLLNSLPHSLWGI